MSKTSTSAVASQTACHDIYNTPNQDSTCAMFRKDNHTEIMQACCGDASIVGYSGGCGVYCVAIDQTIDELSKCLYDYGAPDEKGVWCSGDSNSTKTQDATVPSTAQATVLSDVDLDDDKDKNDKKATGTSTSSTSESSETSNAAVGISPRSSSSTLGFAIGALLFTSMVIGTSEI